MFLIDRSHFNLRQMRRSMSRSWTSEELRTGRSHRSSKSTMGQKIWTHLHKSADDTRICLKVLVQSFASSLANPIHILLLFFMLESKLTFDGQGIDPQCPKGTVKTSSEASYPFGFDLESREHGKKGEFHGDSLWQLCKAIAALSSPDYLFRCMAGVSKRVCFGWTRVRHWFKVAGKNVYPLPPLLVVFA